MLVNINNNVLINEKQVVELYLNDNLTQQEIANVLRVPRHHVNELLKRRKITKSRQKINERVHEKNRENIFRNL